MIEFSSIFSFWWLLPILILSIGFAALLYIRNKKEEFPKWMIILLTFMRATVFFILGFLLISPLVISWKTEVEKAKIILLKDNSRSMILHGDSTINREFNNDIIKNVTSSLINKYEVIDYNFGGEIDNNSIDNDFASVRTDINTALNTVLQKHRYSNIGAIVLMTDGIYNMGNNPIYSSQNSRFPIYTLGFGDTIPHSDIAVAKVITNKTAFIKNKFPLEVSVFSQKLKNEKSKIFIKSNGKIIDSKEISFKNDNDFQKHIFYIEEKDAGLKSYTIEVQTVSQERNTLNNLKTVNVEVLGAKKKVLMLYSASHPDIAAIKESVNSSEEYELLSLHYSKFKGNIKDYAVVILHQMPDNGVKSANLIVKMRNENIPILFVLGSNSGVHYFNALNTGVNIEFKKSHFIETTAILNSDFSEFGIPEGLANQVSNYPPLYTPYGKFKLSNSVRSIFKQQIGSVATNYPSIAVSENSGKRNAFVFGEGLWRWRIYDFMENKSHDNFDAFVLKIIRYIGLNKTNKRFDLQWESQYFEYEKVDFYAQMYNASYEVVSNAIISIEIMNAEGKVFSFDFSNNGNNYSLSAGRLPAGEYSFTAVSKFNNKDFEQKGNFVIKAVEMEANNLLADHNLLRKISLANSGAYYPANDYSSMIDEILQRESIVDIESSNLQYKDLINFPFIMILIILLLSVEWFVRKWSGSY